MQLTDEQMVALMAEAEIELSGEYSDDGPQIVRGMIVALDAIGCVAAKEALVQLWMAGLRWATPAETSTAEPESLSYSYNLPPEEWPAENSDGHSCKPGYYDDDYERERCVLCDQLM